MKALNRIHRYPNIHPILTGFFPPLFLLAHNIVEIPFKDGHRSILIIAIGIVGLLLTLNLIVKNQTKAALITTLLIVLFFSYGHVYLSIKNLQLFGFLVGRSRFLVPIYLLITIIITSKILRQKEINTSLTLSLNTIALLLFAIPLTQILFIQAEKFILDKKSNQANYQHIDSQSGKLYPDIYYIVLDGYPRDDILMSTFGYDNSIFLGWLEENDFYVARCSQANYSNTKPSMAATLNMTYLGNEEKPNHITYDEASLISMIENSEVQKTVENLNYKIITFETGYKWLKWSSPDYNFSAFSDYGEKYKLAGLNGFEVLLIKTTFASILFDRIDFDELLSVNSRKIQQARILFIFEKLSEIPETIPSPKFVYAHVTSPHLPYIFGANGELLANEPGNEIVGYRDQINHINTLVMKTVDEIIQRSVTSPIIIIQGDHGAAIDYDSVNADVIERLAILNAYRLPGADTTKLYPSISPVNTFKLIFSSYLSDGYELLDDVSVLGNDSPFQQLKCDSSR